MIEALILGLSAIPMLATPEVARAERYKCAVVTVIPKTMHVGTRYAADDVTYSRLDPKREEAERIARAPISQPVSRIASLADALAKAPSADPIHSAISECLARHLSAQARGGAMLDASGPYNFFLRSWLITSVALSYGKVKDVLQHNADDRAVRLWLLESGRALARENDTRIYASHLDNHAYWAALAAMAVGRAVSDKELIAYGRKIRTRGLAGVSSQGMLSAELVRAERSYHYHIFAAAPLSMLISLDDAEVGKDELNQMSRLAARIADDLGVRDGVIAVAAGRPQLPEDRPVLYYPLLRYVTDPILRRKIDNAVKGVSCRYQYLGGEFCNWLKP